MKERIISVTNGLLIYVELFLWFEGAWVVSLTQNSKLAMSTDPTFTN